jgi:poly(hydroxyalkanoate) depolymerase family esterase
MHIAICVVVRFLRRFPNGRSGDRRSDRAVTLMARRRRVAGSSWAAATIWSAPLRRSIAKLTKAALRAAAKATVQAARKAARTAAKKTRAPVAKVRKPAPARSVVLRSPATPTAKTIALRALPPAAPIVGGWSTGAAVGPAGVRRYRLYAPPGLAASTAAPLLVMLHGCQQDAEAYAASTRMASLAARHGFFVLWPEQERLANPHGCWNWFETRSKRAYREADSIVSAIDRICLQHSIDPAQIAVAGLSAGAGLAALLALRHPERFVAVAMHSGVAPGAAVSTATALAAMHGRRTPAALPAGTPPLPPMLVIQGLADRVVLPSNGRTAADLWATAAGARPTAPREVRRGTRHPMTVTDYACGRRTVVRLCEIRGLGHAWSGGAAARPFGDPKGPDASRMVWAFVAAQSKPAVARPAPVRPLRLQSAAKQ